MMFFIFGEVIMEIPIEFIAFIGVLIGVVAKTVIPYLRKVYEDPSLYFNWGYFGTMIFSGIVAGLLVYPTFIIPEAEPWVVFIAAVFFAAGINGIVNFTAKNRIQK